MKGMLIILVVLGHFVGSGYHFASPESQKLLHNVFIWIYMFHMPAFFWLAGLLWKDNSGTWCDFLLRKARRLLIPYFVFGLMSIVAYVLLETVFAYMARDAVDEFYVAKSASSIWLYMLSLFHGGGWPNGTGFQMNAALWFLPCMFSCLVAFRLIMRIGIRKYRVALALFLYLFSFLLRKFNIISLPFGIHKAPYFLAFMIIGHDVRLKDFSIASIIVFCLYSGICWNMPDPYWGQNFVGWYLVYFLLALAGIYFTSCLSHRLLLKPLRLCGQYSLFIMLSHKFPMILLQYLVAKIRRDNMNGGLFICVEVIAVVLTTLVICLVVGVAFNKHYPWAIGNATKRR